MDDLARQLEQILNDPGSLNQIMTLASSLGLQPPDALSPEQGPEMAAKVNAIFSESQAREQKQQALVRALLPYLRPGRQVRLERAMQVAHLSHLAGALRLQAPPSGEVGEHV